MKIEIIPLKVVLLVKMFLISLVIFYTYLHKFFVAHIEVHPAVLLALKSHNKYEIKYGTF